MARTVEVRRGTETIEILATKGRTLFDEFAEDEQITQVRSTDWIVRATDYVFGGDQTTPVDGDRIREQVDGVWRVYEVLPLAGRPVFEFCNGERHSLRIHTKLIEIE